MLGRAMYALGTLLGTEGTSLSGTSKLLPVPKSTDLCQTLYLGVLITEYGRLSQYNLLRP